MLPNNIDKASPPKKQLPSVTLKNSTEFPESAKQNAIERNHHKIPHGIVAAMLIQQQGKTKVKQLNGIDKGYDFIDTKEKQ